MNHPSGLVLAFLTLDLASGMEKFGFGINIPDLQHRFQVPILFLETKLYRLQTPTSPFFRPSHYDYVGLDDYPMGTNAIVAVISYTGYDMEDAMIVNKMSLERGFCAGMIYKVGVHRTQHVRLFDLGNLLPSVADPGCLSRIRIPYLGSRIQQQHQRRGG
jgi:hypothetical protein